MLYDASPQGGSFRQGEVLANLAEYRPSMSQASASTFDTLVYDHPLVVVLTADCDLDQDFLARSRLSAGSRNLADEARLLPYTLFSDLFEPSAVIGRLPGKDIQRRVVQNQDERYHLLPAADVAERPSWLAEVVLDFKQMFELPADYVYLTLTTNQMSRVAVVPSIYVHNLQHRFYGYLSRVVLP